MKRAGLIDLLFFLCYPSTIGGEISLSDLFILFIFGCFRPQFHKNYKKVKKRKEGDKGLIEENYKKEIVGNKLK